VYVHFDKWFWNEDAQAARRKLISGKEIKIVYDNPWFWKVAANKWTDSNKEKETSKKEQHNHSHRSKPHIEFDDVSQVKLAPALSAPALLAPALLAPALSISAPTSTLLAPALSTSNHHVKSKEKYNKNKRPSDDVRNEKRPSDDVRPRYEKRPSDDVRARYERLRNDKYVRNDRKPDKNITLLKKTKVETETAKNIDEVKEATKETAKNIDEVKEALEELISEAKSESIIEAKNIKKEEAFPDADLSLISEALPYPKKRILKKNFTKIPSQLQVIEIENTKA
jgi:hypothetical protein